MAKPSSTSSHPPDSALLKRLRQAVQTSGLNADISSLPSPEQCALVTNRLAQTTVRFLTGIDPSHGQLLAEELRALGSSQEFDMLMEDRSFTFYHVVQFLYEFAKHHTRLPFFCAGMGRGGGGIEVAPDREIISLLHLLPTALPPVADDRHFGLLMQSLIPQILNMVFATGLFTTEVRPEKDHQLYIGLQYATPGQLEKCLRPFGLERDVGAFFLNSALHVQGTLQLGCDTFVQDAEHNVEIKGLIEQRSAQGREEIAATCTCSWTLSWESDIRLSRLEAPDVILDHGLAIYDALHRKDLQYYLERIKSLEMQVQALEERDRYHDLIGKSPQMHRVYQTIQQVAGTDFTVLIRGESGTGKELVARAIHASSPRHDRPFIAVNCAAFTETLLESELFGHEKGAFTGADRQKPGRFEAADGGTLFLDEVGDVPLTTQVKLLRALDTQTFERVGGTRPLQVDVRIISATNRNLEELIARGEFREDFYFRLNVLPINIPPLREHPEDIPLLAQHFLQRTIERVDKQVDGFARSAIDLLTHHSWSGNIRELLNVIERAVVVYAQGTTLTAADISQALGPQEQKLSLSMLNLRQRRLLQQLGEEEQGCSVDDLLTIAQEVAGGSGASRRTLQNDLRKLAELGYAAWHKHGSARLYTATQQGLDLARTHQI